MMAQSGFWQSRAQSSGGGVTGVKGSFTRGDLVSCIDGQGREIARGLVNYSAEEAALIKGQSTKSIADILGYLEDDELIHQDNMVIKK